MKLQAITIENFKSIDRVVFQNKRIAGSNTYTLIGINESGKSSCLEAISHFEVDEADYPRDYHDPRKPIEVTLTYQLEENEKKELKKELENGGLPKSAATFIVPTSISIMVSFAPNASAKSTISEIVNTKAKALPGYSFNGSEISKKAKDVESPDFIISDYYAAKYPNYFYQLSHNISFWKSDDRHLINDEIDLQAFVANPDDVSVPLKNCFNLADVNDLNGELSKLKTDPAHVRNLQDKLGDRVTEHIKRVWPNHPIKIKFLINNLRLSFLVEDDEVAYQLKMTGQRSDGFRQFLSFLLTISAESQLDSLSNTILLIDEPETHLHPQAQEYLLEELINITKGTDNNVVIFATHSGYMIDKDHLDRSYRVEKTGNKSTVVKTIEGLTSTYAKVNYEVFGIVSTDYHNELYGYLESEANDKLDELDKTRSWKNAKTKKTEKISIAKYIRNSIHHPENRLNKKFTLKELQNSIEELIKLKESLSKKAK